eukprot:GHVT01069539.1.p1 GENE.GHVT01069539.1~~GHVT01069539.1.p1  ORF type:complete len:150 (-),score=43.41 GHVT01069539.1:504-953(-)
MLALPTPLASVAASPPIQTPRLSVPSPRLLLSPDQQPLPRWVLRFSTCSVFLHFVNFVRMTNSNPPKDKDARLERHSAGRGQAYGSGSTKQGAGKFNWGAGGDGSSCGPSVDDKDPMYDSEPDAQRAAAAASDAKAPAKATDVAPVAPK